MSILLSYHTPQDLSSDTVYICIGKYKVYLVTRGGQSANKITNLQICSLAKFVIFEYLPKVWQFANLWFADPIIFADLKLPYIQKIIFSLQIYTLTCNNSNFYFIQKFSRTNLRPTVMYFCSQGREFFKTDVSFSLSYGGIFADLQTADWLTWEIWGFAD